MKSATAAALLFAIGAFAASAADPAPMPIQISDTEAVIIDKTIRGFVESKKGAVELFDRKKGKTVSLRLDRLITTDKDCVKFPHEGIVALCGECTEVVMVKNEKGEQTATDGDKYVLWFVVSRGTLVTATVSEMFIKSVNGKRMYDWTQSADGKLSATLVPDSAP